MNPAPPAIRIALLDDHPLFRQGLRHILQDLPGVACVTEAGDFTELLTQCREQLPDILLLDLQMPNVDGLAAAELLLKEFPGLKIIVLSMFSADKFVTQMMKLGARSYLPKDATQDELAAAITEVLATGYHFTPRISRALMRNAQRPTPPPVLELSAMTQFTPREQEVLRFICEGLTASKIADELCISRRTVEGHWQKLLEKTGASNVAGLVIFAAKHGFIEL